MATTIKLKNGSGAPLAGDLVQGEPALDLTNKRLYTENAGGTVIEIGTSPSTIDINAGTIDGTVIGGASAAAGTFTNLTATGTSTITTADINGGNIDGTVVGASSAAAGTFTTFTSTGIDDNATSTAITIDASQNVGIGTTNTDPYSLGITGRSVAIDSSNVSTGSLYALSSGGVARGYLFANASNMVLSSSTALPLLFNTSDTERMRIDSSGNVGIGTSSPQTYTGYKTLHVAGPTTTGSGLLYLTNSDSSVVGLAFAEGDQSRVTFGAQTNHPVTFLTNDTERMRIDSSGNVDLYQGKNLTWRFAAGSTIRGSISVDSADNITFSNGSSNTERMRIDTSGNVGIGTTSFSSVLTSAPRKGSDPTANSTITGLNLYNGQANVTGDGVQILFDHSYGTPEAQTRGAFIKTYSNNSFAGSVSLAFGTSSGNTLSEKVRIDSSGNVGIGTSSPAAEFQVVGKIRFSASGTDANRWNVYWNGSTGDLIVVSSDARLKEDFDYGIAGIETVKKLKPVRFTWKENNKRQLGFTAQESLEADEHLAWHDEENDQWGLDGWEGYAAVLTKAIQEQQAMIEELKVEVAALKGA